ncbi:hypothetical protein CHS0354_041360 [Potamilus streckersoni]|uniref:Uncharacterized protein n=1 Tax=Potamilus streckersoni TaxID=2493646 RepID=A0AAE0TAU4_9BIVA|nr:hypothetical protein CHS0354_041360 [Potamilus streckersoni]
MDNSVPRNVHLRTKWREQESEGIVLDEENIHDLRVKDNEDDCGTKTEENGDKDDLKRKRAQGEEVKNSLTEDKTDLEVVKTKYIVESDNEEDVNTERCLAVENQVANDQFELKDNTQDDANDDEYGDGDNNKNDIADNEEVNKSYNSGVGSDDDEEEEDGEIINKNERAVSRIMQHLSSMGEMEEPKMEFYTFSAKLPNELDCLLTGVIVLGKFILVADNENKNVKRFSLGGAYVDYIDLEDPCGMCVLKGGSDFAVTQPDFLKFTIVLGDIPFRRKCDISTEKRYDCIASISDGNLVCGCCKVGKTCVDIINLKGEVLMSHREREDGSRLFRNPAAIATVKTGEIIVSDSGSNRLVVLTQDGSTQYFFETTGRPSGVAVDGCGCAFVAHFDANTVLRYSPDGSKEDLLSKWDGKVKSPLALALTSKYLVLTEEMPSDRVIVLMLPPCPVLDATNQQALSGIHLWIKQA